MDLEKRIAQLSPANLALLEQKLRENKAESWPKAQPASARDWPEPLPLHGRLERRAEATPPATTVEPGDAALTYQELNRRASGVARWLRSQGIDCRSVVGTCPPRSLETAGAACMAGEPDFSEERGAAMVNDAQVGRVSTTSRCPHLLSRHDVNAIALDTLELDRDDGDVSAPPLRLSPADLASVLFTSGSTDQPKDVLVSHGAIGHRPRCLQEAYHLGPGDRVRQKTPYAFGPIGAKTQIHIRNERFQPSPVGGHHLAEDDEPWLDESSTASPDAIV